MAQMFYLLLDYILFPSIFILPMLQPIWFYKAYFLAAATPIKAFPNQISFILEHTISHNAR